MRKGKSRQEIIEKAGARFFTQPFSKLTMSEVTAGAGVSRRTFYKLFPSKESFLEALLENFLTGNFRGITEIKRNEKDIVRRITSIIRFIQKMAMVFSMSFLEDLQKNYPYLWEKIDEFRAKHAMKNLRDFMEEGVRKGKFRKFDTEIITRAYVGAIRAVINPQVLANLSVSADDAIKTIFEIFMEGLKK
jgi:AcrR family transcriptional regulator